MRGLIGAVDRQRLGLPAVEILAGGSRTGVGHESVELHGGLRDAFGRRERACPGEHEIDALFVGGVTRELGLDGDVGRGRSQRRQGMRGDACLCGACAELETVVLGIDAAVEYRPVVLIGG